eukprot:7583414-Lingulodinium_polyedra.AAC.1
MPAKVGPKCQRKNADVGQKLQRVALDLLSATPTLLCTEFAAMRCNTMRRHALRRGGLRCDAMRCDAVR